MHLQNQKRLTLIILLILMLMNAASGIGLYYGKVGINESDYLLTHTAKVITAIDQTKIAYDTADMSGRLATAGINGAHTEGARHVVQDKLFFLRSLVADNPKQIDNVNTLGEWMKRRFDAQDASIQARELVEGGKTLQMPVEVTVKSNEAISGINSSFQAIRETEGLLLMERSRLNVEFRRKVWLGLVITLFINCGAVLAFGIVSLKHVSLRRTAGNTTSEIVTEVEELTVQREVPNGALAEKLQTLQKILEGTPNGT